MKFYVKNPDLTSVEAFLKDSLFQKDLYYNEECTQVQTLAAVGERLINRSWYEILQQVRSYFPEATEEEVGKACQKITKGVLYCTQIDRVVLSHKDVYYIKSYGINSEKYSNMVGECGYTVKHVHNMIFN